MRSFKGVKPETMERYLDGKTQSPSPEVCRKHGIRHDGPIHCEYCDVQLTRRESEKWERGLYPFRCDECRSIDMECVVWLKELLKECDLTGRTKLRRVIHFLEKPGEYHERIIGEIHNVFVYESQRRHIRQQIDSGVKKLCWLPI